MVGTVAYLPPEQALGRRPTRAVTSTRSAPCSTRWSPAGPRSSAGSVAIVAQHLHARPVAPALSNEAVRGSWTP